MKMLTERLMLILLLGTIIMSIMIAKQMKGYGIPKRNGIIIAVFLVITGVIGSEMWYFIENFSFGGRSFYGAIYFAPLVFWPVSRLIKAPYTYTLDFCAPSGCLTLALVKIQCLRDGCCQGKILYVDEQLMFIRFPSQIVEMVNFLLLAVILFSLSHSKKMHGRIFPVFLLLYGATRFVLDFFRGETTVYALGLTAGSFWSAWAFLIGAIWLAVSIIQRKQEITIKEQG